MKVERFTFKELGPSAEVRSAPVKVFTPSGRVKELLPPPPPPPPTFSADDLKSAERDGYKKGFLEGVEDGKKQAQTQQSEAERQLVAMLGQFTSSVTPLFDAYRGLSLQIASEMPKAALAVARKVAGAALTDNAAALINDLAIRCCESMATEPKLTITVHESLGDSLEQRLQEIASRLPAATDIIIMRNPEQALSDCRIEWRDGFMERSTAQLWQQLERVINDMSETAAREHVALTPDTNT